MIAYITQALNHIENALKFLNDSKDPFENGDLVEVRETEEYVEVEAPQPKPCEVLSKISKPRVKATVSSHGVTLLGSNGKSPLQNKTHRAKAIVTGVYGKQKGEKISNWRRRIIKIYNEIKGVNYNPESKFYTTARINEFIKEIQEIERAKTKEESFYYNSEV